MRYFRAFLIATLTALTIFTVTGCNNSEPTQSTLLHGRIVAIVRDASHWDAVLNQDNEDHYFLQICNLEERKVSNETLEGLIDFNVPVSIRGHFDEMGKFIADAFYERWHWRQDSPSGGWEYVYNPDQFRPTVTEQE